MKHLIYIVLLAGLIGFSALVGAGLRGQAGAQQQPARHGGPAGGRALVAAYCAPVHNRFVSWAFLEQDARNMLADERKGTPRARRDAAWEARVTACELMRRGYAR